MRRNWIFTSMFSVGLTLLGLAFYFGSIEKQVAPGVRLARAVLKSGRAQIFRAETQRTELFDSGSTLLYHRDSIETLEFTEVLLELENSAELLLTEDSKLLLERPAKFPNPEINVVILRGEPQLHELGRANSLTFSKNGKSLLAQQYQKSDLQKEKVLDQDPHAARAPASTLTDEEVASVLSGRRNEFQKCFAQLLQKDASAKGQSTLRLTIEPTGKVTEISYNSSNLQDAQFRRCLSDVALRSNFRSFTGESIYAAFPIVFE